MTEPKFLKPAPGIHGSVIAGPDGEFLLSSYHVPTCRAVYGIEYSPEAAVRWLAGARFLFAETEGGA